MPARFVNIDRDTPRLVPPDLRQWVPEDHLAHYVLDAIESLPLTTVRVNERGPGDEQFPPRMMLGVVIYCSATGTFSSRAIERASDTAVAVRFLTGDTQPDHATICEFRRQNGGGGEFRASAGPGAGVETATVRPTHPGRRRHESVGQRQQTQRRQ